MKSRLVLFSALFFLSSFTVAQVKYEKEERIPIDDLPPVVQALLPQLQSNAKRMRYYREFDGATTPGSPGGGPIAASALNTLGTAP